jgi:hypothetical protein
MAAPLSSTDGNSPPAERPAWRRWLADRRWGVAVATGGVFAASLVLITAAELIGQRPISGSHDRDTTSIGSLFSGSEDPTDEAPAEGDSTDTTAIVDGGGSAPGDSVEDGDGGDSDTTEPEDDGETPPPTGGETDPPATDPPDADPAAGG